MNDVESARKYFDEVKRRVISLRNNRDFRFLNTSRKNAARWLDEMTHFEGFSDDELVRLEAKLEVRLPTFFRLFLNEFGKSGNSYEFRLITT